jgi:hypothetical protein
VTDVLLMVGVVVVIVLGERHERRAADAEKDERGNSLLKQG